MDCGSAAASDGVIMNGCGAGAGGAPRRICSFEPPRSILISMQAEQDVQGLVPDHVTTLALVVNELMTNAIKHAFAEGKAGHISLSLSCSSEREAIIIVDDDGLPFPEADSAKDGGMGLGLVKRLVASTNSLLIQPASGSKCFEIRVPCNSVSGRA